MEKNDNIVIAKEDFGEFICSLSTSIRQLTEVLRYVNQLMAEIDATKDDMNNIYLQNDEDEELPF